MPRPRNRRLIRFHPGITYFKPRGVPLRRLNEVCLEVEELEALRLKDRDGLDQQAAARRMGISDSTFQRILYSAHRKIADALIGGQAIALRQGLNDRGCCRRHRHYAL